MIFKSFSVLFVCLQLGAECGPIDSPSEAKWQKFIKLPSSDGASVGVLFTGGVLASPTGSKQPELPEGFYVGQTVIFGSAMLPGSQDVFPKGDSIPTREGSKYTYDDAAGGWLKYHKKASWPIALMTCQAEGAILASPVSTQVRDAIEHFVSRESQSEGTIHAGVQARVGTDDFFSVEGVDLKNMPVNVEFGSLGKSNKCVKWMTSHGEVTFSKCQEQIPFVCLKKKNAQATVGCGNTDLEYKYDERSGSCYKMHTIALTWSDAYRVCKKEGGYLAIVNNELEKQVLMEIYNKHPYSEITGTRWQCVFMGMRKWAANEFWMTVQGQELEESGFTGWAAGEPNYPGSEFCGCMYRYGTYNDANCEVPLAYICEKNSEILFT